MKWFLLMAYLLVHANIHPQDTTFQFLPKWIKGESKNIEVVYTQEYTGAYPMNFKMSSSILFSIYDVIEDTFFVQWKVIDLKLQSDASSEMFSNSDLIAQELKNITYNMKVNKKGEFISLLNSDEIVNRTIEVTINTMKGTGYPVDSANIANLRNNTWLLKEKINSECKKLLLPLTCAYDSEYPTKGSFIKKCTERLDTDSVSMIQKTTLLEQSGDFFTYEIIPEIENSDLKKILHKPGKTEENYESEVFMNTTTIVKINRNDGWVYYVKNIVNTGSGDNKVHTITEYTLQ